MWIVSGTVFAFTSLSLALASVPSRMRVTDDTAIYQRLSEIQVAKEARPNFDADIDRLSGIRSHYRESLPPLSRIQSPMKRISSQKYKYSGRR
jgi:hypothetical protein